MANINTMANERNEWYEYDEVGDVLEVYFTTKRPAWTIEVTPNILISIDRAQQVAVSLTLLDYTVLCEPTEWGARSFPNTGLADLPLHERKLVLRMLNTPPVNHWLDISSVQTLPDSSFAVTHLAARPATLASMIPTLV